MADPIRIENMSAEQAQQFISAAKKRFEKNPSSNSVRFSVVAPTSKGVRKVVIEVKPDSSVRDLQVDFKRWGGVVPGTAKERGAVSLSGGLKAVKRIIKELTRPASPPTEHPSVGGVKKRQDAGPQVDITDPETLSPEHMRKKEALVTQLWKLLLRY